jgi:hypothetical protein
MSDGLGEAVEGALEAACVCDLQPYFDGVEGMADGEFCCAGDDAA